MNARDAVALRWVARLFLVIGIGAAIGGIVSGVRTLQFVSESTQAEGLVVDWTEGSGRGPSSEDSAYYRVIEVETPDGQRVRGEAETGVGIAQLEIGERLTVRYRAGDPTRMRVVSLSGLWLVELVAAVLAVAFGGAGGFLLAQARH
jgi:hypothetical protein